MKAAVVHERKVLGFNGWLRDESEVLIRMTAEGELDPIIDKVLPLEDVNEAFRLLEDREVFGDVLLKSH